MYKMSEKPLVTKEEIENRIAELGNQIRSEYDFDVILSALTCSFIFTADLCRSINKNQLEIAFIKASSYGSSTETSHKLTITGMDHLDIQNKRILLVDDILDTGHTMNALVESLKNAGAAEIRTCVLLNKEARREVNFHADYCGFNIENKFVVGYGLDFDEKYRTLPSIWTLVEV